MSDARQMLEDAVNHRGLQSVLNDLAEICDDKEQSSPNATEWEAVGVDLRRIADQTTL